jgi:hypothetical protein
MLQDRNPFSFFCLNLVTYPPFLHTLKPALPTRTVWRTKQVWWHPSLSTKAISKIEFPNMPKHVNRNIRTNKHVFLRLHEMPPKSDLKNLTLLFSIERKTAIMRNNRRHFTNTGNQAVHGTEDKPTMGIIRTDKLST